VRIALVHDYLTQRGGAERVALSLRKAFPGSPLYTSLYEPERTFDEFRQVDVRTLWLDRFQPLRTRHRLALPFLAPEFSRLELDADVAVCSSSGWAHGARVTGRKVVYCHTPARWLYQPDRYLGTTSPLGARSALRIARRRLLAWDRAAAASASRYLANSTVVRDRIRETYGIDAEIVHPPCPVDPAGPQSRVEGVEPGYFLCVARLLPYKNVDAVLDAFRGLRDERLVVVGSGPEEARLHREAPANATFLCDVSDDELRWLFAASAGLVAASYEDFGLTPVEAAAFGRPTAALRFGGYLDTVREGVTGVFFDSPQAAEIQAAVRQLRDTAWHAGAIATHADRFSEQRFVERIRAIVAAELNLDFSLRVGAAA
jgi:glycosyltransferase involved in cell wall biosynthesis